MPVTHGVAGSSPVRTAEGLRLVGGLLCIANVFLFHVNAVGNEYIVLIFASVFNILKIFRFVSFSNSCSLNFVWLKKSREVCQI